MYPWRKLNISLILLYLQRNQENSHHHITDCNHSFSQIHSTCRNLTSYFALVFDQIQSWNFLDLQKKIMNFFRGFQQSVTQK